MKQSRRQHRTVATDPRPRLVLLLGAFFLAIPFLFPRWYIDLGNGWMAPKSASSQRGFLFGGAPVPTKNMRMPQSRGELVTVRLGKVRSAYPDWRRAFQEGAVVVLCTGGLWWFYYSRSKRHWRQ